MDIFRDTADRYVFMRFLDEALKATSGELHAYVLMPNHVHLLVTPRHSGGLSEMIQSMGRRFARFFNDRRGRTGTLFEGRFKSSLVDSEEYLLTCMRYVETNPVRAGLAARAGDYPWCSFNENAGGSPAGRLTPHAVYLALGAGPPERSVAYQALFREEICGSALADIRRSAHMNRALGTPQFLARLESQLGRPVGVAAHGGDRRSGGSSNLTP